MKKLLGFIMIAGLAWFVTGCNPDPGPAVETEITEEEEMDMLDQVDPAAGAEELGADDAADTGDAGEAEAPAPE